MRATTMAMIAGLAGGCAFDADLLVGPLPDAIRGSTDGGADAATDTLPDAVGGQDAGGDAATGGDSGPDAIGEDDGVGDAGAGDSGGGEDAGDGCVPRFHGPDGPACECPEGWHCDPIERDDCAPGECDDGCGTCISGWACVDGWCARIALPPGRCLVRCDCPQGQECNTAGVYMDGSYPCIATDPPRYCCDKPGCPSGQVCQNADGSDGPGDGTRWSCPNVIFCPGDPGC